MRSLILAALALLGTAVSGYELLRQCDFRWSNDLVGFGSERICAAGSATTCVAMVLEECEQELYGWDVNPGSLNRWLKENNGYVDQNKIVWSATNKLSTGVQFVTLTSGADSIKNYLDRGNAAILRVSDEPHYVLGTSYTGTSINVLDPRNVRRSYKFSEVLDAAIYSVALWCKAV